MTVIDGQIPTQEDKATIGYSRLLGSSSFSMTGPSFRRSASYSESKMEVNNGATESVSFARNMIQWINSKSTTSQFTILRKTRTTQLQGRLQDMIILELRADGGQEYLNMTLRGLYDYVLNCITNRSRQTVLEGVEQQQGGQPSTETSHSQPSRVRKPTISLAKDWDRITTEAIFNQTQQSISSREKQTSQNGPISWNPPPNITGGERLGGYLHPRDMRRLVTPFSSSNAPEFMVRRHVMLINFDPLRAIVLRDRLLVLVPDGADSILIQLQRRLQGNSIDEPTSDDMDPMHILTESVLSDTVMMDEYDDQHHPLEIQDEWESINCRHFIHTAFELQAVDAVLATVCNMLSTDASLLKERIQSVIDEFRKGSAPGDHAQDGFRLLKDSIKELQGRVQGVVRALDQILDNDEDMALINLSRLLTHPQRFIHPVSRAILSEESEGPELILEAYLQQALSEFNALGLLRGNIIHAEDQVLFKLDSIRNQILYVNNIVTVLGLGLTFAACVASFYGMNLQNRLETRPNAFAITFSIAMVAATAIVAYFMRMIQHSTKMKRIKILR